MKKKLQVSEEVSLFLERYTLEDLQSLLKEILGLIDLFNVDEQNDWLKDLVGEDNCDNVRLARVVYIISRLAEFHAGKLLKIRLEFPHLWERMEKVAKE